MEAEDRLRSRSSVWSSDTLVQGMSTVTQQPNGLLVKTEEDETMVREYHVPHWEFVGNLFI